MPLLTHISAHEVRDLPKKRVQVGSTLSNRLILAPSVTTPSLENARAPDQMTEAVRASNIQIILIPFNDIALDAVSYSEDSLVYRWWARHNLYHTLISQDWLAEANDTLKDFIGEYRNSEPIRISKLGTRLGNMHPELNTEEDFNYLKTQLLEFTPSHTIDSVSLEFYKTYLDFVEDSFKLSKGSKSKFENLAKSCLFFGGPMIGAARNILVDDSTYLFSFYYYDTLCVAGSSSKMGSKSQPKEKEIPNDSDYRLHPNLLKDRLTANITLRENEQGYVEVYSMQGRKLGVYSVSEGTNHLDLINISYSPCTNRFYRVLLTENGATLDGEQNIGTLHCHNNSVFGEMTFSKKGIC